MCVYVCRFMLDDDPAAVSDRMGRYAREHLLLPIEEQAGAQPRWP